jgi:thiosulfate/3-mercaptopyruvate sulfurtransferase
MVSLRSSLISVEELHAALESDGPTVLDVRWELGGPPRYDQYREGHIPGAVFVDVDTELAAAPGPKGRHPLPPTDEFTATMRDAGVSSGHPVVVYDAAPSVAAARAWWLLRYFGHQDVTVLDGGLAAWVDEGYPLQREVPVVESGDFVARPGGMPLLDADGAAELASGGVLLDARAPERFRGDEEPIDPVAGHIPGARNVPYSENIDGSGRFLDPGALRERFERGGVREDLEVGAYCGSGVSAAHEVLALTLAGYRPALYVGSWSEWITDPERPVARGE